MVDETVSLLAALWAAWMGAVHLAVSTAVQMAVGKVFWLVFHVGKGLGIQLVDPKDHNWVVRTVFLLAQ